MPNAVLSSSCQRMHAVSWCSAGPSAGMRAAKRAFDLVLAASLLVLLAPLLAAATVAIRIDSPGPALFRQPRVGMDGRVFEIWKFRTLLADACDASARRVVVRDDPRVTRVGRFLRRTSIDELPQLVNVLRGEMSLVGPRPHVVDALTSAAHRFEDVVPGYGGRHRVAPGLTGLAQVRGWRGEIRVPAQLRARVACDLRYIERWSPVLDLWILLRTVLVVMRPGGAY